LFWTAVVAPLQICCSKVENEFHLLPLPSRTAHTTFGVEGYPGIYQSQYVDDVLQSCNNFLQLNPREKFYWLMTCEDVSVLKELCHWIKG
jgi:hypothetical protein